MDEQEKISNTKVPSQSASTEQKSESMSQLFRNRPVEVILPVDPTDPAILLFDEGDSLFEKRSEVKDSHDRYSKS